MLLYTFYWLALVEVCVVNGAIDPSYLEPNSVDTNTYNYDKLGKQQGVSTNELDDEPKFASAYPTLPSEDAKTLPVVPVGKDYQPNMQDTLGATIRLRVEEPQSDIASSPVLKQDMQKLRDLSSELKNLAHHVEGFADQDSDEKYEPHLFISVPWSLKGMDDLKFILDITLFKPLQSLFNGSCPEGKEEDNQHTGERSKRTAEDSETTTPVENLEPTTVHEEITEEDLQVIEFLQSLKRVLDEETAKINRNLDILEDVAFSAAVLQHVSSFPIFVKASPEIARLTYNNFLQAAKPQPVSFHETHAGNLVFRHDPSGMFFGTMLAKAAPLGQQQQTGVIKDSQKIKGELKDEPQTSTPLPPFSEWLRNLEKSSNTPLDPVTLSSAIVKYFDSTMKTYSQIIRKLRSGVVLEPKGEL